MSRLLDTLLPVLPNHLKNEEIATQISMIIAIYSNYCWKGEAE